MTLKSHISALKQRHAKLDQRLTDEGARPMPDQTTLNALKLEKLRLKEEVQQFERKLETA